MEKVSYALGMAIGRNLKDMHIAGLDTDRFAKAVAAVVAGEPTELTEAEAQATVQSFLQKQQEESGRAAREAGEAFLAANAKKEGVVTLPSGLQYSVEKEGTGKKPTAQDTVECHYEGRLIDGTVFDSSYRRGETATFPLSGVIAGWTEGLQHMAEGAKYRFFIPYQLAYGERGAGANIPPYAALVFDVELVKVI